jgi:Co/Zn/Cd efflux system component
MAGCHSCASDQSLHTPPPDGRFRRVLWIALVLNALMFVVEVTAGILSGSVSLQADAVDFFADSANYGISLFVLGMGIQARARAALFKGATMAVFGVGVLSIACYRFLTQTVPDVEIMGATALLALATNVFVAALLFRYRSGDSNMRSIWLCSRNDALANLAVIAAASGVLVTGHGWPDVMVAAGIATLNLTAARQVIGQARTEMAYPERSMAAG